MQLLKNKTAIITGASSGIGQQAALLFAQNGARLVIVARREQALQDLAEEIRATGADVAVVAGDVRDKACQARAVAEAETRFGGLHIAFNNAGWLGEMGPAAEISVEGWNATLETLSLIHI